MKNENLIQALNRCINNCNYCADACLDEENIKMMVSCIRNTRACAEVCSSLQKLLVSNYENIDDLVRYCAKLCRTCADECSTHNTKHCQDCAEACRKCEEECKAFLA